MDTRRIIPRDESFTETVDTGPTGDSIEKLISDISSRIVGQDRAIKMIGERLCNYEAKLNDPDLPAGVILCLGPTGVGKSEVVKEFARLWIADTSAPPLTMIDCESHAHGHEISELVGSPPGYIGHDTRPKLSQFQIDRYHFFHKCRDKLNAVIKQMAELKEIVPNTPPDKQKQQKSAEEIKLEIGQIEAGIYRQNGPYRSVILFDEIEKGSKKLFETLLHICGEAKLQMMRGGETHFQNSFIFITSNIGAREINNMIGGKGRLGFGSSGKEDMEDLDQDIYIKAKEQLERIIPPELMGRLRNDIVVFRPLGAEDYRKILEIQLAKVQIRFFKRDKKKPPIFIRYTDGFKQYLLDKGIDQRFGARPLKARIAHSVVTPLSHAVLSGNISFGDNVLFDIKNGEPVLLKSPRARRIIVIPPPATPSGHFGPDEDDEVDEEVDEDDDSQEK